MHPISEQQSQLCRHFHPGRFPFLATPHSPTYYKNQNEHAQRRDWKISGFGQPPARPSLEQTGLRLLALLFGTNTSYFLWQHFKCGKIRITTHLPPHSSSPGPRSPRPLLTPQGTRRRALGASGDCEPGTIKIRLNPSITPTRKIQASDEIGSLPIFFFLWLKSGLLHTLNLWFYLKTHLTSSPLYSHWSYCFSLKTESWI